MPRFSKGKFLQGLGICLILLFSFACAQPKQPGGSPGGPAIDPSTGLPPTLFPHPQGWLNPASHGAGFSQYGLTACLNCHKVSSEQVQHPLACQTCHPLFPHSDQWANKANHGSYVLTNGKASCATQCHGTDLQGGLSHISCNACHTNYPHAPGWVLPAAHGNVALGDGKNNCKGCHGADLKGSGNAVSCYTCHSSYPHDGAWLGAHGAYVNANSSSSCATERCHGLSLTPTPGVTKGPSCSGCHASYPHPPGWNAGTAHGAAALANITTCKICHGNGLNEAPPGKNTCQGCHPSYLGHASAQMPGLVVWGTANGHGQYLSTHGWNFNECKLCHGNDFTRVINGKNCFTCHADFPHTNPNWRTGAMGLAANVHASTFIAKIGGGDATACQGCHGAAYDRVLNGSSCTTCHTFGVTHQTGWSSGAQQHGTYFSSHFTSTSAAANCKDCHGDSTFFTDTQTKPALTTQSICYSCHWTYPHTGYDVPAYDPGVAGLVDADESWDTPVGWGHVYYLMRSALFTDSAGTHPTHTNDPILITPAAPGVTPALQYTCGGNSANNCHFNGYRTTPTGSTSNLCGKYCHKP